MKLQNVAKLAWWRIDNVMVLNPFIYSLKMMIVRLDGDAGVGGGG